MKLNKMSKEDLELLSYSQIGAMYLEENKTTMSTSELFKEVCKLLSLDEDEYQEKITDFFQSLTTSKDFILLNDGKWDLRKNHKVKVEIDDIYEEKEEEIDENYDEDEEIIEDDLDDDFDIAIDDEETLEEDEDLSDLTIINDDEIEE